MKSSPSCILRCFSLKDERECKVVHAVDRQYDAYVFALIPLPRLLVSKQVRRMGSKIIDICRGNLIELDVIHISPCESNGGKVSLAPAVTLALGVAKHSLVTVLIGAKRSPLNKFLILG